MVKVINRHAEKKLTIAEILECDNTCILEDGRVAFCPWLIDANLFDKVNKKDSLLCLTINDDGEPNLEYIHVNTPATPCNVEITVD